jgi:hypothetical protein
MPLIFKFLLKLLMMKRSVTLNKNNFRSSRRFHVGRQSKEPQPQTLVHGTLSEEHPKIKPGPGIRVRTRPRKFMTFVCRTSKVFSISFSGASFDDIMFSSFVSNIRHTSHHLPINACIITNRGNHTSVKRSIMYVEALLHERTTCRM